MNDGLLLSISTDRWDELVTRILQEHIGYNCTVVIERSNDNRYGVCKVLPCVDYPEGRVLFNSYHNGIVMISLERAYSDYCIHEDIVGC